MRKIGLMCLTVVMAMAVLVLAGCPTDTDPVTVLPLYTVSFDVNDGGGTAPAAIKQASVDAAITLPGVGSMTAPSGKSFAGWTVVKDSDTPLAAGASYTPSANITLYAKWADASAKYTVTFNVNDGSGSAPAAITQASPGAAITLPGIGSMTAPANKTFAGWTVVKDGTDEPLTAGASYTPSADITLYAHWVDSSSVTLYEVTFNVNGGSGTAPAAIKQTSVGEVLTLPGVGSMTAPTGKVFAGWNTAANGSGTDHSEGQYTPTADIALYAKWVDEVAPVVNHTVTFDSDGGSAVTAITVADNATMGAQYPTDPTKSGYAFDGWYKDGTKYTKDTVITADVTLKAQWTGVGSFTPGTPVQVGSTVVHENPQLKATAGNFGEGATLNADGTVTLAGGGGVSYQFPELANGYDTITIEFTVTGFASDTHAEAIVKQYETSSDYTGSGNQYPWLDSLDGSVTYELSGFGASGGFSWQFNSNSSAPSYTVKITKITFKKIDASIQDYTVGLSGKTVKNGTAFPGNYSGFVIPLDLPTDFPIDKYTKLDVTGVFYDADGTTVMTSNWGYGMVKLLEDPTGTWDNNNLLMAADNLNMATTNMTLSLSVIPGGLVVQNASADVKFIEITEIKFHN